MLHARVRRIVDAVSSKFFDSNKNYQLLPGPGDRRMPLGFIARSS